MKPRGIFTHIALLTSLSFAVPMAACGGGGEGTQGPGPVAPTATPPVETGTAPTPTPTASGTGTTSTPPPAGHEMKPIAPSAMEADLKEIGLDPKNLPALDKMPPDKLRKVMNTFKKALGVQCTGCHDGNNMKAPTPKKKLAAKMWNEFTRNLAMEDGSALYCDSCHQGHDEFLDRHDAKALGAWMDANYVSKLKRKNGKDHSCETCHGDPFEPKILADWSK